MGSRKNTRRASTNTVKKKKASASQVSGENANGRSANIDTCPSSSNWAVLLSAFLVLVIGCALPWLSDYFSLQSEINVQGKQPSLLDRYERLTTAFAAGGNTEVKTLEGMGAGTFAKKDFKKGDTIMYVEANDLLPNEQVERKEWYPQLLNLIESALETLPQHVRPTRQQMMTVIVLLLEVDKGKTSKWFPYIDALPQNVTHMSWYWTDEEMLCVVPRQAHASVLTADKLQMLRQNFHVAFNEIWSKFGRPLAGMTEQSQQSLQAKAEWAYLMVKTRAFGNGKLNPIFDMINHDPTKSVSLFHSQGISYHVATKDIAAGEQFYNSYGSLPPVKMADTYGFVEDANHAAYVNVPSLSAALQRSPNTKDIDFCTHKEMLFFGNVTEGRVEARFKHLHQTTYYKPFHPSELPFQCVRVLLQSEDGPTIAKYMLEKLQLDAAAYHAMATASYCQSESGNYPIIRKANAVTARLLQGAIEVAQQAARGEIAYPDIPYP